LDCKAAKAVCAPLCPVAGQSRASHKALEIPRSVMNGDKIKQGNLRPGCDESVEVRGGMHSEGTIN